VPEACGGPRPRLSAGSARHREGIEQTGGKRLNGLQISHCQEHTMNARSTDYTFLTTWRVAGTTEDVADLLSDPVGLTRWWPSVYLSSELLHPGQENGVGRMARLHTKGWLPYTLRWTLTVTEPITNKGFAIRATGDLDGTGRWTFEQDGPESVITYDWRVIAAKPLLRRLSWLLKPGFAANHRWAMARGQESLALELRRRRAGTAAHTVPAPPPPTFPRVAGRGRRTGQAG
jgi:hypothetical protein